MGKDVEGVLTRRLPKILGRMRKFADDDSEKLRLRLGDVLVRGVEKVAEYGPGGI